MRDVQDRLGIKIIIDLLRKEVCGKFGTKDLTEKQKMKYIRSEYQIPKILRIEICISMQKTSSWKK